MLSEIPIVNLLTIQSYKKFFKYQLLPIHDSCRFKIHSCCCPVGRIPYKKAICPDHHRRVGEYNFSLWLFRIFGSLGMIVLVVGFIALADYLFMSAH
jgi:hypothetical protein